MRELAWVEGVGSGKELDPARIPFGKKGGPGWGVRLIVGDMSEQRVAPVSALQPPTTPWSSPLCAPRRTPAYGETAERLGELVQDVPGFLGEDSARTPGGLAISVAYFRDLEGIEQWRAHAEHRAAKDHGRAHWYERYCLHIAKVEHSHGFERTPQVILTERAS